MKKNITQQVKRVSNKLKWTWIWTSDTLSISKKDFSWKVRQRMKKDRNPLFIELQDKFKVKEYARERGVKTPETFFVTDQPETIPFETLPDHCFIKANHGCGWNILFKDRELFLFENGADLIGGGHFSKHRLTRQECIRYCDLWLKSVYSKSQWVYQQITPKIFAEEILVPMDGEALVDYRCFTFQGKVKAVQVTSPIYHEHHQNMFVDPCWQEIKLKVYREKKPDPPPCRPESFGEIISSAERLGAGLDFARIDIYNTTRGIMLGEMTIYPEGGDTEVPTGDAEFNQWLGDQWVLPASIRS